MRLMHSSESVTRLGPASAAVLDYVVYQEVPEGTLIVATTEVWDRLRTCVLMSATLMDNGSFAIGGERVGRLITELASSGELALMKSNPSKPTTTSTNGPETN